VRPPGALCLSYRERTDPQAGECAGEFRVQATAVRDRIGFQVLICAALWPLRSCLVGDPNFRDPLLRSRTSHLELGGDFLPVGELKRHRDPGAHFNVVFRVHEH